MLTYYYHPLSSYCWKALIGLYELGVPFTPHVLHLQDADVRSAFAKISPLGKMPALVDDARGQTLWESSILIEYADRHYPGPVRLVPEDRDAALAMRHLDRFFDLYIHNVMQEIIGNRLRPEANRDAFGVAQAHGKLRAGYTLLEKELAGRDWAAGSAFTMADCAAFPALFYANCAEPIVEKPVLAAYLQRLKQRASIARVVEEARPFFKFYPGEIRE